MPSSKSIGLGLIGCGSFGAFCLRSARDLPLARPVAVADARPDAAKALGAEFDVPAVSPKELIERDDVHLVHLATPPSSHHELTTAAIRAGKHVLCEKPLAVSTEEADAILEAAEAANAICPVNFVLRHNAVTDAAKAVLDSGALGKPLSARLTNCATDSFLPPEHWFWDKSLSGGIFIEHGVHFFDLYRYWLGEGRVVSARAETRPGTNQEDRVTCVVRHERGALVSHYHGFDQIAPMDRAEHRIVCEMGDVRVFGWIPLTLVVDAAVDEEGLQRLESLLDGSEIETIEPYATPVREILGRGQVRRPSQRVRLTFRPEPGSSITPK